MKMWNLSTSVALCNFIILLNFIAYIHFVGASIKIAFVHMNFNTFPSALCVRNNEWNEEHNNKSNTKIVSSKKKCSIETGLSRDTDAACLQMDCEYTELRTYSGLDAELQYNITIRKQT